MFNDWIHPEDLIPMPQCIAQQDQSTWLSTMTKCTRKRCTSRFGVICLHHQWLTQLSCLSTEFSSDAIKDYLPYCSRSVLAKAQLYHWIRSTTGRTWLVDVGDTNGLQNLSPASLAKGYAAIDVTYNAPTCLTGSLSAPSTEPFQHVMGSCSFTSTTQYTGNTARLWEYSESLRSMVALGFETVGYDLVGGSIKHGDYFDKDCFCNTFTTDPKQEACSRSGQTDLTRERLWFNATCGPTSLPDNWTDVLKTIGFAYIPIEDWHWPTCVTDMPKRVTELTDQCATDACQLDSSGYCKVKRAIDRTCFCRDISYDSCGGSCQIFETRIDYGREHNFYLRNLDNAERGRSAKVMYAGALLWLIIMLLVFVQLMRAIYRMARLARSRNADLPKWRRRKQTASNIVEELGDQLNEYWTRLGENLADYGVDGSRTLGETSSTGSEGGGYTTYGTLPTESKVSRVSQKAFAKIYIVTAIIMLFLWVAQWLFWGGFISLSSDEFCPPKLGFLTAVWVAFSLAGAIIRATV
ncbi:Fc.00g094140.m01.CDS01 [Cosmosporella sp. VM-42]